ncbi:hypothetical protein [Quadrisphaera sp. INWT6]|uniref:hypothetical protein n=1 Tax=Quadrisphaera sp. INWT6 TaxID=2596917 RepID=UPI0018924C79|nr:hypothetical protein [Quadrisphaera sp. INWT6]MBF5082399.1 hypothetical protein [Quadrisphaera sp. INWT6]
MLQAAVACGAVAGMGVFIAVRQLAPTTPDLTAAVRRMTAPPSRVDEPEPGSAPSRSALTTVGLDARLGRFLHERIGDHPAARIPRRDLAVLQLTPQAWLGQKAVLALVGLAFPSLMVAGLALVGAHLPVVIPVAASLALALALWFVPDVEVRTRAATARGEFARAVTAYIDLTALERAGGTGTTQSLENAAQVGGSWVFQRIRESLHRSRFSGSAPWQSLSDLSEELGVPELADLADIMRLSGEEGVAVYDNLRARSRGMRTALLAREHARANADSERMVVPVALLGLLFLCLLAFPALMRVL